MKICLSLLHINYYLIIKMDSGTVARKGGSQCAGCSMKWSVFRRKKSCFCCKNNFCHVCIIRRSDKKMCCKKCQILTATPLNKNDLLNLRSRDLVNYLSSKQISTSGCVEKEDLVNVLMKAFSVNNASAQSVTNGEKNSSPSSPTRGSASNVETERPPRLMGELSYNEDGIRVTGIDTPEDSCSSSVYSAESEVLNEADWVVLNDRIENPQSQDDSDSQSYGIGTPTSTQEETEFSASPETKLTEKKDKINRNLKLSDITCAEELETLSVKELKTLLMTNRTDYKGCIERTELVDRARRLWNDYTLSRKDLEKLSLDELCKICMDAPIECVLLECGHMATCMTCGKQLSECPLCRQYVVRCVRTFKV